jgi:hypothetical protein
MDLQLASSTNAQLRPLRVTQLSMCTLGSQGSRAVECFRSATARVV